MKDTICLQLNPTILGKLMKAGLNTADSITTFNTSTLSKCTGLTEDESNQVLKTVADLSKRSDGLIVRSAFDILQAEQAADSIVTFSEGVDSMLGSGVPLGKLTEICGVPGTGKTQLCLQLAADVHIPKSIGGVNGEAVYIDTERGFVVERLQEISEAAVKHCGHITSTEELCDNKTNPENISVTSILAGTHIYRCADYVELMATVQILPKFLDQHKNIKLLIIDSLARPFRSMEDMALRRRLLTTLTQILLNLAAKFKVAVVVTNQMTTKIMPREGDSHLIPALGDNWAHAASTRVILSTAYGGKRVASLYKAPNSVEKKCEFKIVDDGVRDDL